MEDVAVEAGQVEVVGVAAVRSMSSMKACSLPRRIDGLYESVGPQWPTLQAGSIVSDYINNLHIVSRLFTFPFLVSSLWSSFVFRCLVRCVSMCRSCRTPHRNALKLTILNHSAPSHRHALPLILFAQQLLYFFFLFSFFDCLVFVLASLIPAWW